MNETMTIQELAEVAGCSEKTVRKVLKQSFPNLTKNGKVTKLSKEQAFDLIAKLPKRNLVGDLGKSSKVPRNNVQGDQVKTITQTVIETLVEMGIITKPTLPKSNLVALPTLDTRSEINKIIRRYSEATKTPAQILWNQLYTDALYRMHRNYKLLAENRGISAIQACAEDGRLDELLAIANNLFDPNRLKLTNSFVQELEEMKIPFRGDSL